MIPFDQINWNPLERIHYSSCHQEHWQFMGREQNSNRKRSWEKVYSTLTGDFEGIETWVEEVIADMAERVREVALEVEAKDMTTLLPSHDKIWTGEELLQMQNWWNWFVERESTTGKKPKIVKMTRKYLIYCINLVDKAGAGFERIDSSFESVTIWVRHSSSKNNMTYWSFRPWLAIFRNKVFLKLRYVHCLYIMLFHT